MPDHHIRSIPYQLLTCNFYTAYYAGRFFDLNHAKSNNLLMVRYLHRRYCYDGSFSLIWFIVNRTFTV